MHIKEVQKKEYVTKIIKRVSHGHGNMVVCFFIISQPFIVIASFHKLILRPDSNEGNTAPIILNSWIMFIKYHMSWSDDTPDDADISSINILLLTNLIDTI